MTVARPVGVDVVDPEPAEAAQRRVAGALAQRGIGPGDRVAFCLPSSGDLLVCALGAARRGVTPVMLSPDLTEAERGPLLDDADPSLTVTDHQGLRSLLDGPGTDLAPCPRVRPMHYTSGTTGRPKGVWSGVLDDEQAQALFDDEADLWAFDADDVHLVCSPMHHSVSIRLAAAALLRGGRVVTLSRFDAGVAVGAIAAHRPTTTFMAPTALQRLLAAPDGPETFTSFRRFIHAGSACAPALKRAAMERLPAGALWEFYGSTEGQFTVCPPDEWLERPGTVGRARPRRRLEVDEAGTIWCHAPDFARFRYWRDPDKTASAWRDDAFTVGDLGRLDADGFLYLDGRRDDLIISGGVNVYPAEVEAALAEVDGVEAVAVFGVADPAWGEQVCAAVIGPATEADLQAHATVRLAPYKRPKRYFNVVELPHTSTGKLRRLALAEQLGLDVNQPR